MDGSLKDQAFEIIQRDRLSELFKVSDKTKSGCFYASLANAFHHLNPGKMLPRSFEKEVLFHNPQLSVDMPDVLQRIEELRDILHLEISEVTILSSNSVDKIRGELGLPSKISVMKVDTLDFSDRGKGTGLIFWQGGHPNHISSTADATILRHSLKYYDAIDEAAAQGVEGKAINFILYLKKSE
jgi:hypothetical protein